MVAEKADIMRENADLDLVDQLNLRRRGIGEQREEADEAKDNRRHGPRGDDQRTLSPIALMRAG
jgi:hypothetical protein